MYSISLFNLLLDVIELHNLIGLSMFENDKRTMDQIAKFHTVGSAIAPLIYGLKKNSGLVQFLKACEPIWDAVDKDHELCDSFVRHMCTYVIRSVKTIYKHNMYIKYVIHALPFNVVTM